MRIFIDTEFEDLRPGADLLSIGLVAEDGRELYLELTDGWCRDACSPFVLDHVLPLMDAEAHERVTRVQAVARIVEWLKVVVPAGDDDIAHPILVSDSAWDWDMVSPLLMSCEGAGRIGYRITLPEDGLDIGYIMPRWTEAEAAVFNKAYEGYFTGRNPTGLRYLPHHALVDARALRHAFQLAENTGAQP